VKYTDKLLLLAKEETVLQGMIGGVIEISICYGTEMNVIKTKIMRISRQPFTIQITINHKQQENV
jgi:cytochrome c oxidase assembly factor CtaG